MNDLTLPEYAQTVLSRFSDAKRDYVGWVCKCPVPAHGSNQDGDQSPSLRISVGTEGRLLVRCRVGCPTRDVLDSVGLNFSHLYCPPGQPPVTGVVAAAPMTAVDQARLERLDDVYRTFLDLPELKLSLDHQRALYNRGLSDRRIEEGRYRTLPSGKWTSLAKALYERVGPLMYEAPGFYPEQGRNGGAPTMTPLSGMIFPVYDCTGCIQALKVRRDESRPKDSTWAKYVYLSHQENSTGVPVYCPLRQPALPIATVRITEGELKADIASHLSGIYTLGFAGVNCWDRAVKLLPGFQPTNVLLAFDAVDVDTKRPVCEQTLACLEAVAKLDNVQVFMETWDSAHKGIDDALLAEVPITRLPYMEARASLRRNLSVLSGANPDLVRDYIPNPVPSFPVHVFPESVRAFVEDVAESLPCPPDFVAPGCLVAASTAIGTTRCVEVKPGWQEYGNLFLTIVGQSSVLKSPALSLATRPIKLIEEGVRQDHKRLLDEYEKALYTFRGRQAAANKLVKDAIGRGETATVELEVPEAPKAEHTYVEDITIEALMYALEASPRGLAMIVDEILQWKRSCNQYRAGKGADDKIFLKLWQSDPIKFLRRSRQDDPLWIPRPFLSLLGSIQPQVLCELADKKSQDDGGTARFLFVYPEADTVPDFSFLSSVSDLRQLAWKNIVDQLYYGLDWADEQKNPRVLPFDQGAREVFLHWHDAHRDEANHTDFPKCLQPAWSKMKAYCVRLSLLLHCLWEFDSAAGSEVNPEFIGEADVVRATQLCEYFKAHARKSYRVIMSSPEYGETVDFVHWARRKGGSVVARDLIVAQRPGVESIHDADKVLARMASTGIGWIQDSKDVRGRHQKTFHLAHIEDE